MNLNSSLALKMRAAIEGVLFTVLASFLAYVILAEAFAFNTTLGWIAFSTELLICFGLIVYGLWIFKSALALTLVSVGCVVSCDLILGMAIVQWAEYWVSKGCAPMGIGMVAVVIAFSVVSVSLIFLVNHYFKINFHTGLLVKSQWRLALAIPLLMSASFYVLVMEDIFLVFPVSDAKIFGLPGIIIVTLLSLLFLDLLRYSRKQ